MMKQHAQIRRTGPEAEFNPWEKQRSHDEPEVVAVANARDGGDGSAVQLADEQAAGVGVVEARGVVEAGVPALVPGPRGEQPDLVAAGRADRERLVGLARGGFAHGSVLARSRAAGPGEPTG